jgi:predicted DNA-binding transcriptional regulator YafY
MPADYSRIHRLLKILTMIQGSSGWTPKRLAQECGTTERTIYRDLQMLQGAGIPYFFDEQTNGYSVRKDFFLPPVQLTLDEALSLVALAEQIGAREQVPYTKLAGRAISKVRSQLPVSIRSELERIVDHVAIKLAAAAPPEGTADVYETVRAALAAKTSLLCEYESVGKSSKNNASAFLFKPYTLLFNQRAWYAIGHHGGHDDIRCLKLNRFTRIEPTTQLYKVPRSFTVDAHLGNAWRMIRGSRRFDIELRFDAHFADTISDTHWHATQDVQWNDDGSITFRCTVDGLDEIVWWVLSMGPHCTVRKPAELAQRVRQLAEQMVALYAKKRSASRGKAS